MTCQHYADLYGRCIDCGLSWAQRQKVTDPLADPDEPVLTGDPPDLE